MLRVHPRHLQGTPKLCSPGSRKWFNDHGLSWADFVKEGIDAERLKETGDPMALIAVRRAEEEADGRLQQ